MKGANFLPFVATILVPGLWWWLVNFPLAVPWVFLTLFLGNLLIAFWVGSGKPNSRWWNFSLLPLLSQVAVFAFIILSTSAWLVTGLIALTMILTYVYWRYVYFYSQGSSRYTSFSLENLSFYINFLIIYLSGAVLFGLRVLLNYKLSLLIVAAALVALLVNYQLLWVSKVNWSKHRPWLWVNSLLLTELFWALSFLPLDYNLLGFFWASCFYLLISLFNDLLSHKDLRRRLFWYALLMSIGWLVLLLTAKWL